MRLKPARGLGRLLLGGLAAVPFASLVLAGENIPAPVEVAQAVTALSLAACRQIALDHQPAVVAARASLAAASARAQAVDNLHVPRCLAPDLPVRRKQAGLGVSIASAGVVRAEADTIYTVTYSYLAYQYAGEQLRVAEAALTNLGDLQDNFERGLKAGNTNVSEEDRPRITAYKALARSRKKEAEIGRQRALAALREALGLGPDAPLVLADLQLPRINVPVDREQVLALALTRRPEIVQAATLAQVTDYEVCAQEARRRGHSARTFASGSDIHANVIPPGAIGLGEEVYRHTPVPPEMPGMFAGNRCDRVEQARAYSWRAAAVAEKTRNLIALEVEEAYLDWKVGTEQLPSLEEASRDARKRFDDLKTKFDKGLRAATVGEWMSAGVLASDLRVQINQVRFRLLVSLAQLERATAGAFCAGLDAADVSAAVPGAPNGNGGRGSR